MERQLIKLLRHDAKKLGVPPCLYGYYFLSDIKMLPGFEMLTKDEVLAIAAADSKGRFEVRVINSGVFVRASTRIKMHRIITPTPMVHWTNLDNWEDIRSDGLESNVMGQEYIHCSRRGLDARGRCKSGYSVRVHLDVASMLHAGMEIYSSNDELLIAADSGVVCPCHFKMAQTSSGERLDFQCILH